MRSYYSHLGTTASIAATTPVVPRPTLRSSAIFPVIQTMGISSRVLFMGYWMLKRSIQELACIVTLRATPGNIISRTHRVITEAKSYTFELADQLELGGLARNIEFVGSIEVEFFSVHNLVFPFPAVVINYYGPKFSTVVHSAQRIYNDFDDMSRNSETKVPESGFNIYADKEREPFIGLINGPLHAEASMMQLHFINHAQKVFQEEIPLGPLAPYETSFIYPGRTYDLEKFLDGRPGAGKVKFHVDWIFPRLLVGNLHKEVPALTITHTYYDCSQACSSSDYWLPAEAGWHPASLMIPAIVSDFHYTNVYFYAIYSPSTFAIDVEIYNAEGTLLGTQKDAALIEAPQERYHWLELKEICRQLNIATDTDLGACIIARPVNDSRLPARIKIGIDIGIEGFQTPCNICANLHPFNPALEAKPISFRWSPILADQPKSYFWMMNSSPIVDYQKRAEINLTFFRQSDTETLKRTITLAPHSFFWIAPDQDSELKDFFQGAVGWVTATTNSPYTTCYYFAENASGVVGGDHGF